MRPAVERGRQVSEPGEIANPPIPPNVPPGLAFDLAESVVVVPGLPRSGTSMLMQMPAAGGLEPFVDGLRAADEDSPKGYIEHEAAMVSAVDPVLRRQQAEVAASVDSPGPSAPE